MLVLGKRSQTGNRYQTESICFYSFFFLVEIWKRHGPGSLLVQRTSDMSRTWDPVASTCVSVSRVFRWHAWNLGPYRKHYAEPGLEEHIASLCTWEVEANTYLSTYLLGNNALRVSHWDKPSRSWKCSSIFIPGDSGLSNTMYSTQVSSAIFSGMFEEWTVTHLAFDTGGGVCLESCVSLERFLSRLQFLSDPFMNLERLGGLDWCVGKRLFLPENAFHFWNGRQMDLLASDFHFSPTKLLMLWLFAKMLSLETQGALKRFLCFTAEACGGRTGAWQDWANIRVYAKNFLWG